MRKGWGVLLLTCAASVLSTPQTALAAEYEVQVCLQPGPAEGANGDVVVLASAPPYEVAHKCTFTDGTGGVRVAGSSGASGDVSMELIAPSGARITGATLYHHTTLPSGAALRVWAVRAGDTELLREWLSPAVAGASSQQSATGPGEVLSIGAPAERLLYAVTCSVSCDALDARLFAARVRLEDLAAPGVALQARGTGDVVEATVAATDGGSGVAGIRLLVDGAEVETRSMTCHKRLAPCPPAVNLVLTPSAVALADGVHRVRVEARDLAGQASAAEADVVVDRRPPVPLGAPGVVGTPEVGATLVAASGSWSGQSHTLAYRWERCRAGTCVAIAGGDGQSYVVRDEDQEHELRVVEVATDGGGSAEQRSTPAPPVSPQVPVLLEPVQLSGEERVGGRLSASAGSWRNAVALSYQWRSCARRDGTDCTTLPGRERPFLEIDRDDVGRYLVLVVTAIGPRGHTRQASAASGRIASPPLRNLTEPSIGGTAVVGGKLTAETGAWEGTGLRFETQWLRCDLSGCLPISGAIARTYTPTSKDFDKMLAVLVTARDTVGEEMPIRSRVTERVRNRSAEKALAVPRVRTRVRIVSFGEYQFALTVGPLLQVLDVSSGSRVDVTCRLCARARLGRRSKVKGGSVKFRLPADGVQIPPGGQIVVRVRRKGTIGREIVGTLSLDRSRRVSWGSPRCLDKDGSLRTVACPTRAPAEKKTTKAKGKSKTAKPGAATPAGPATPAAAPPAGIAHAME